MDFIKSLVDVVLHLDAHLADIIGRFGGVTYLILFGIVFCETGLVVAPFLPGDSLLFAAGTFAPFVAGVGSMRYSVFLAYNVIGGILWVVLLTLSGYFFGNIPVVRKNFSLVVIAIVVLSTVPVVLEYLKARRRPRPAIAHKPHVDG